MMKNPLSNYYAILKKDVKPNYLKNKSSIKKKIEDANEILKNCKLCERKCGVNRLKNERGFCKVLTPKISSKFVHMGEEEELIPSFTIFFTGCTFDCVFCQNWEISQFPDAGKYIEPKTLAEVIENKETIIRNINWVGGDPTSNLPYILEVLENCNAEIPQIWNSNMYLTKDSLNLLDGVIDVYLTDFKYGNDNCAKRLSKVENYWEIITRNHKIAREQCEIIIRHLVLPNHIECCTKPIIEWLSENLKNYRLNLMDQYRPQYHARDYIDINRVLKKVEFNKAWKYAEDVIGKVTIKTIYKF